MKKILSVFMSVVFSFRYLGEVLLKKRNLFYM